MNASSVTRSGGTLRYSSVKLAWKPPREVAVGTTITDRPPHRSVRARLAHTAPTLDTGVKTGAGVRMQDSGERNPAIEEPVQVAPVDFAALAPANQRVPPQKAQPMPEQTQRWTISRNRKVLVVARHHTLQPLPDQRGRLMHLPA